MVQTKIQTDRQRGERQRERDRQRERGERERQTSGVATYTQNAVAYT